MTGKQNSARVLPQHHHRHGSKASASQISIEAIAPTLASFRSLSFENTSSTMNQNTSGNLSSIGAVDSVQPGSSEVRALGTAGEISSASHTSTSSGTSKLHSTQSPSITATTLKYDLADLAPIFASSPILSLSGAVTLPAKELGLALQMANANEAIVRGIIGIKGDPIGGANSNTSIVNSSGFPPLLSPAGQAANRALSISGNQQQQTSTTLGMRHTGAGGLVGTIGNVDMNTRSGQVVTLSPQQLQLQQQQLQLQLQRRDALRGQTSVTRPTFVPPTTGTAIQNLSDPKATALYIQQMQLQQNQVQMQNFQLQQQQQFEQGAIVRDLSQFQLGSQIDKGNLSLQNIPLTRGQVGGQVFGGMQQIPQTLQVPNGTTVGTGLQRGIPMGNLPAGMAQRLARMEQQGYGPK
jgi:hypothetical protein